MMRRMVHVYKRPSSVVAPVLECFLFWDTVDKTPIFQMARESHVTASAGLIGAAREGDAL